MTAGELHGDRRLIVTHHFEAEIDVDDLNEWIDSWAHPEKDRVQVMDAETSEVLYDSL
jgi:hypothetical protein